VKVKDICDAERGLAIAEYEALHVEIGRHDTQMFEMFKFALTGAVAVISFALQQKATNPYAWALSAIVPLIVVPAGLFSLGRVQMQMRIGAYIRTFYEERASFIRWESSLARRSRESPGPDIIIATAVFAGYTLIGLAGLAVAWAIEDHSVLAHRVLWAENITVIALAIAVMTIVVFADRKALTDGDKQSFREIRDGKKD